MGSKERSGKENIKGGEEMYPGNLSRWIAWWARVQPEREAVVFEGRRLSYGRLDERINRLARGLREAFKVEKGDRVACLLRNCTQYYEIFFACARIGARFVPVNIRLTARETDYILGNAEARVLFTERHFDPVLAGLEVVKAGVECVRLDEGEYEEFLARRKADAIDDQAEFSDDLAILYTSGTTGQPKGAVLRQLSVLAISHNMMAVFGHNRQDRFMLQLPLCFTGALIPLSMPIFHAGGTIFLEREFDPGRSLELIEKERITVSCGVPTLWTRVSDEPAFRETDFSSVRLLMCGAAPVPPSLVDTYREKGVPFTSGYGLTEAGGFNLFVPPDRVGTDRAGYLPLLWNDVRYAKEDGSPAGPGEIGEILIRGPVVMRGYWKRPAETAETIRDGWLHTGDLARVEEDGSCHIVDRAKDMIVTGGLNVYPAEVEHVLCAHPKVLQVAVVGVPHRIWGEMVLAVVVPRPGETLEAQELAAYCRRSLADYKVPKSFVWADSLPMTTSGKVQKRVLRERLAASAAATGQGEGSAREAAR